MLAAAARFPGAASHLGSGRLAVLAAALLATLLGLFAFATQASAAVGPGRLVITQHNMDIVLVGGYQLGEPLLVEVVRNGAVVGKAQGEAYDTADGPGFEINHGPAGAPVPGDCWDNFTPDVIPGDTIRVTAGDPLNPRVVDTSVVSDIRFTDGPRRDASGNVIVEGEAVGPNGVGRLAADEISADVRVISPRIRPGAVPAEYTDLTGTHWRAAYTASTPGVIEAAQNSGLTVEQVLDNLATNTSAEWTASHVPGLTEETVADFGETGGPGPGCEGSPRQQNTVVADDAAINIDSGTLVVSGTASPGTAKVEVSVSDGTTTLTADASASLSANTTGPQTWSHTFDRLALATLNDGNVTIRATFDGAVAGDAIVLKKDTSAPALPTATPPAGTYQQTQSVTLNLPDGEAATSKIRYTKGTATVAAPTATSGTVFTTDILVTAPTTQTIKAVAIDAAGNVGNVATFEYAFDTTPPDAPTGLVATGGDSRVSLNWDDNVETDLAGYEVYRSTTSGGPYTKISGATLVAASDYVDTNVTNGFTYFYVVRAVDNGKLLSGNSNQATGNPRAPVAAPSAPTGLQAAPGNARVDLSWTAVSGATGYNIYRSTTSGSFTDGPVNGTTPVTGTSFANTGLTNGTQYFYVVRAVNDGGESANSSQVSATPTAPAPTAPTGLAATAGDAKVDLRWNAVTGATTYNIYRATGGGTLTRIASPTPATATTFTDSGLTNGTTYTYAVRAVNANGESVNSNQVTATPTATTSAGGTFTFAPAADVYVSQASPTTASNGSELQAVGGSTSAKQSYLRFTVSGLPTGASVSSAKLRLFVTNDSTSGGVFNTISNTTFAETINWNTKPAIDGPQVGSLGAVALNTFQEITLPAGTVTGNGSVAFAIRLPSNITNTLGYASRSHTTVANRPQLIVTTGAGTTPTEPPATAPAAPTGLQATAGDAKVDLSWTAVSGATGYNVYRSTTSGSLGTRVNTAAVTSASFSDTGLTNGTQYFYVVRAVNSVGESVNSTQVTATPRAPVVGSAPAAPTGLAATAGNARVDLSWTAVSGATGYNIYRSTTSGSFTGAPINGTTPVTTASFADTGLTNGTTYFYVVRAVNANGESGNSNQVSARPTAPTGGTFTFAPAADVYVSQASPTTAFNGSELQAVGGSTSAKESYLRFTVSGLPTGASVSQAKLRLFVTNDSTSGGVFNKITNTTFAETINWNTKPAIDGPQVGSLGAVALNTFQEITLPAGTVTGNGSFAFAIRLPSNITNTLGYASRSHATVANRPQLIVTT